MLDGPDRAPARAMLYPTGFKTGDFQKPVTRYLMYPSRKPAEDPTGQPKAIEACQCPDENLYFPTLRFALENEVSLVY